MKPNVLLLCAAALAGGFLLAGCETDNSSPTMVGMATPVAPMGPPPPGITTVKMLIDTNPPDANISLNGMEIGSSPKEVHLEVDRNGNLAFNVTVAVSHTAGSTMASLAGPDATNPRARNGSHTLLQGERMPARLHFNNDIKTQSAEPAPYDTKPTSPTATRVD